MATKTTKKAESKVEEKVTGVAAKTVAAKTAKEEPVKKEAAGKTTAKETAAKKTAAKKPAAEKTAAATRKTTAKRATTKKAVVNTEVFVQFWGKEVYANDVVEAVKKAWTDEGHEESEIKDLKVYIKPEDNGAHFVINGDVTGFISL